MKQRKHVWSIKKLIITGIPFLDAWKFEWWRFNQIGLSAITLPNTTCDILSGISRLIFLKM